jgi:hypothetical protein
MFTKDNTYIYMEKKGMGVIAPPIITAIKIICFYAHSIVKSATFNALGI